MNKFDYDIQSDLPSSNFVEETYLLQVFTYYNECYMKSKVIQNLVYSAPYIGDEIKESNFIGLCDRSLGSFIPSKRSFAGGAMRGALQRMGLIKPTGHELFRGCVLSPKFNCDGQIISAVGYRVSKRLPRWVARKVYWERKNSKDFILEGLSLIKEVMYEKT